MASPEESTSRQSKDASSPTQFRSVLPHEPLPDEPMGYIHMQGAFTPRIKHEKEEESSVSDASSFWTRESLTAALFEQLQQQQQQQQQGSEASDDGPNLPHSVTSVQVLDPAPPFTKVRLTYPSPLEAYHVLIVMKRLSFNPSQLFGKKKNYQQQKSKKEEQEGVVVFGRRSFQVTPITRRELPPPEQTWCRSNPPKFRRLLPRPGEDMALLDREREQTRFVFMTNLFEQTSSSSANNEPCCSCCCWSDPHCVVEAIRSVVNKYDTSSSDLGGAEIFVSHHHKKLGQYCHVGMRSNVDARALINGLQERQVVWEWKDWNGQVHTSKSGTLFLDYAAITQRSVALAKARAVGDDLPRGEPTRSECTSTTDHVNVPGLVLIEDFVSEAEEETLLAVLTGPHAPWAPSQSTPTDGRVVKRRVQHYGYVFDYKTANVLRDRTQAGADCPPMPTISESIDKEAGGLEEYTEQCVNDGNGWSLLAGVIERSRRHDFAGDFVVNSNGGSRSFPDLNQLTVNSYAPGEGIGSHVDTPSAFGDGLISITLNGGTVMEFRKEDASKDDDNARKLVYLPPRSLLLMSGPSRYTWEHMIVTRMTDTHNGEVLERKLRVSLTLRTALSEDGTVMPLVESCVFPPTWGGASSVSTLSSLSTPDCERNHVHAVYDAIATQWHHTRGRRGVLWPGATQFLQQLAPGSVVADVGCGDGKYFPAIWEAGCYVIGMDISLPLLRTSILHARDSQDDVPDSRRVSDHRKHLRNHPSVVVADCMSVPLRSNSCDAAICIAVLHHLSTRERRIRCIEELARIVRPGGVINVQAWAMEQEEGSRRKFASNDVFVPFNAQPKYLKLEEGRVDRKFVHVDAETRVETSKSTAQMYSEAFNADYDDRKGLVVFQRYCHLYKQGELEELAGEVPGVTLLESGFESGNYFVIVKVLDG